MDIIAMAAALKKAISQTKDIIASHFVAGTNIEITDNPDGTQTINASGKVSATDEVARQAISDHEADLNNPHSVTKNQIGLGNVDNTSDTDKPISTATQTALNGKQDALTFDSTPTSESANPVTSGGVYTALGDKQDTISDLATIRSNASTGAGAAEVVTGINSTANNYIEMKSGQREYLSTTVPTGNVPLGSVGMGFNEGVYTYKSGTKVSKGVLTVNLAEGIIEGANIDSAGKIVSNSIFNLIFGAIKQGKKYTVSNGGDVGYFSNVPVNGSVAYDNTRHVNSATSFTFTAPIDGYVAFRIPIDEESYSMNEGETLLPYEPYDKQKISFYANGQSLADYTIYGNDGGVGDEVTDSESAHYGEYDIPIHYGSANSNTVVHIYLTSPLGANDSIDYTTSQVDIPTVDGLNSLICDTTVQPSKVSLTYTGWHSDLDNATARKVMGITETGNDHIKMGNGITLYISATQPTGARTGDLWIGG